VYGQLIASAKLMYDLDLAKIGPKLLAIKDVVIVESARRHKRHSELMDQFHRHMEETLSAGRQEGIGLCIMLTKLLIASERLCK